MKTLSFLALSICLVQLAPAQINQTWTQTSAGDFSSNIFDNTVIANRSGGEIRLQYPIVKSLEDTVDNTLLRYLWFDRHDNFLRTWSVGDTVFAQRYDSTGFPLSAVLKVNEPGKGVATVFSGMVNGALMDNGYFYVMWYSRDSAHIYGQLYNDLNQKVGGHVQFDLFYSNTWKGNPSVFADNSDLTFGVIESHRPVPGATDSILIYFTRVDLEGTKLGELSRLPATVHQRYARYATAAIAPDFDFIVTWVEDDDNSSGGNWIRVQRFDREGSPLSDAQLVSNVNGGYLYHVRPRFDSRGRYLIPWTDNRNAGGRQSYYDVYAQLFDSDDRPLGMNFMVSAPSPAATHYVRQPEVRFIPGGCRISWAEYKQSLGREEVYYTEWTENDRLDGTCISSVHDSGPLIQGYQTISWNSALPAGTHVRFQMRSSPSLAALDTATWYGPASPLDFYVTSGTAVNARHTGHRFIQYKAFLSTPLLGDSPELEELVIAYQLGTALPPSPPTNLSATTNSSLVRLSWHASSSSHLLHYNIYRGFQPGVYDSLWTKRVTSTQLIFLDSTVQNGTAYYYAVSVTDSNFLQSSRSNEVEVTPQGIRLYVRSSAPPGGNGTPLFPFNTITQALEVATYGDTVVALPGAYPEFIRLKKGIRLIGSGPRATRLQSSPMGDTSAVIWGADSCVVRGFTIALTRLGASWKDAIVAYPGSFAVTDNVIVNEVSPNTQSGCYARGGDVTFLRNFVVGFNSGFFNFDSSASRVENNVFVCVTGVSAHAIGRAPRIINNTIIASNRGITFGYVLAGGSNVRNNLLVAAPGSGTTRGINVDFGALAADYNDICRFSSMFYGNGSITGVGNIPAEPLFFNEARGDYRMRQGSPCTDAGDPSPEFNDLDETRNDIGAFGGPHPIDESMLIGSPIIFATGNASGFSGDSVTIGVSVSNAARFSRGEFVIEYLPSFIRTLSVERTSLTQNFQLSVDTSLSGRLAVSLFSFNEIGSGAGNIVELRFRISPETPGGQASPLSLTSVGVRDSLDQSLFIQEIRSGAIVLNPGSGPGRYVYVDQNNPGTEDGTRYHPFRRIQPAINAATVGDTVVVAAGYYQGFITMRDSIHLLGSGAALTTVRGDSTWPPNHFDPTVHFYRVKGCSMSGFTVLTPPDILTSNIICDSSVASLHHNRIVHTVQISTSTLVEVINGSHIAFHDSYIYSDYGVSAYIQANRSYVDVRRNTIGSVAGQGGIVLREQSRALIGNNRFFPGRNVSKGIDISACAGVFIHNNLVVGGTSSSTAMLVRSSDSVTIVNNIIDTKYRGIDDATSTTTIINNIVTNNASFGVSSGPPGVLRYNDVWGNAFNYYNTPPGYGDLSLDPLFVDQVRQNYHLSSGSPCRDAGDSSAYLNDLDGSRNDIGLYGGPLLDTTMFPLQGASLSLASQTAVLGDTFALPLTASFMRDLASATILITFDPAALSFVGARTTSATAMLSLTHSTITNGTVRITLSGAQALGSDSACVVELLLAGRQSIGSTTVDFQEAECYSPAAAVIPVQRFQSAHVTIGSTGVGGRGELPPQFALMQNYPNPFNPETNIRFTIPAAMHVQLEVFDILGRRVSTLVNEMLQPGEHRVAWKGQGDLGMNVATGVYFSRLTAGSYNTVRKLLLLR